MLRVILCYAASCGGVGQHARCKGIFVMQFPVLLHI